MLSEDERRAIVGDGTVWLANGLRASLAGIKNPDYATVTSAKPGFWACSWDTAKAVVERPDRRFTSLDFVWRTGNAWLGVTPGPDDFQTVEDYERAKARGEAR
jgi:hypothetical protein